MLLVAMAQSSSDGIVVCNVLTVLWMTTGFHTVGPMGRLAQFCMAVPVDGAAG